MVFQYHDGGRKDAGFQGDTGDCVTRAIAIAARLPYLEVYEKVNEFGSREYLTKRRQKRGKSSARTGVYKPTTRRLMAYFGFTWTPMMHIGSGCKVHMKQEELPGGMLVLQVSGHLVAVENGCIYDTHDPSRGGTRCVYGYWRKNV